MGHLYGAGNAGGPATLVRLCYSFQDLLFFLLSAPMGSLCTVIQDVRMKDKMTNNDRYRSCSQMGKGDERGEERTDDISISVPGLAVCCLFCQGASHACL